MEVKLYEYDYSELHLSQHKIKTLVSFICDLKIECKLSNKNCFSLFYYSLIKHNTPFIYEVLMDIFSIRKSDLTKCFEFISDVLMESVFILKPWTFISVIKFMYDIDLDKNAEKERMKQVIRDNILLLNINPFYLALYIISREYKIKHNIKRSVMNNIRKSIINGSESEE